MTALWPSSLACPQLGDQIYLRCSGWSLSTILSSFHSVINSYFLHGSLKPKSNAQPIWVQNPTGNNTRAQMSHIIPELKSVYMEAIHLTTGFGYGTAKIQTKVEHKFVKWTLDEQEYLEDTWLMVQGNTRKSASLTGPNKYNPRHESQKSV